MRLKSDSSSPPFSSGVSRRQFLGLSGALAAASWLSGCAVSGARPVPAAGQVQLLFYADTLAQWLPSWVHPRATHLGPMALLGQAPYITEEDRLTALGLTAEDRSAAWLTAGAARQQPQQMGGYARLAQALEDQRQQHQGPTVTLEAGQCWTGSGLAQLSEGRHGPESSHWLGADLRLASDEAQRWPARWPQMKRDFGRPILDAEQPFTLLNAQGLQLGVLGIADPWRTGQAQQSGWSAEQWALQIQQQINLYRQQADLLLLVTDAGTNPSLWLAQQLSGAAMLFSAGGQDLWPEPLLPASGAAALPVCCAGQLGQGYFAVDFYVEAGQWRYQGGFQPLLAEQPEAPAVQRRIAQLRAPYGRWLDEPLATSPNWLYRQATLAGSWDALIAAALASTGARLTLAPGVRTGLALPPDHPITREHLLSLTAGLNAPVFKLPATQAQLRARLEAGADELIGESWWLHSSRDLPRLSGSHYVLRYQAALGQRVADLEWPSSTTRAQLDTAGWSPSYQGEGPPLWQLMEGWLRQRPASWTLPQMEQPSLAFVEGHPGWHPEATAAGAL
ncbi:hypothetical protein V6U78_09365 [Marinospirillum sp. MEB164]|uniref:Tat (Twin-arginine translocation) pathway signal sequence n=1 Tax=Marinospirillum alkalitolerans TaxID=3123374 RepID=A0ABW8PY67_9GAMM